MLKRLVAALVLVVLSVLPAKSNVVLQGTDDNSLWKFGVENGCKNLRYKHNTTLGIINGSFAVTDDGPFIRVLTTTDLPDEYRLVIYFHELGHCMQYEENWPLRSLPLVEQDADKRGAEFACENGMDGIKMGEGLLQLEHDRYGYNGDENHGTLAERRAAIESAPSCQRYRFM